MFINKTFYKQSYLKNIYNFDEIAILDNIVEFWTVTEGKKKKKSKRIYERWKYKESLKENNGGEGMMSSIPQPSISQKKKAHDLCAFISLSHNTLPSNYSTGNDNNVKFSRRSFSR